MDSNDTVSEAAEAISKVNFSDDFEISVFCCDTTSNTKSADDTEKENVKKITRNEVHGIDIKSLDDGRYEISFHIPTTFHGMIIGKKGETVQRIRSETNTSIHVPWHQEVGDIVIKGETIDDVVEAYRVVKGMIAKARTKQPHNRFISVPMTNQEITQNFLRFKEEVLLNCKDCAGVSEEVFQNPNKMHLTAGVMMLADEVEDGLAVDVLKAIKEDAQNMFFKDNSLKVRVRGIEIMNDDPLDEVKVLFAKIEDSSGILQKFMDYMVDRFFEAGLMKRKGDHVKLHMTVLNSRFYMRRVYGDDYRNEKWHVFDATKILQLYKDYDFGTAEIKEVHLSHINTTAEDGFYVASCKIAF